MKGMDAAHLNPIAFLKRAVNKEQLWRWLHTGWLDQQRERDAGILLRVETALKLRTQPILGCNTIPVMAVGIAMPVTQKWTWFLGFTGLCNQQTIIKIITIIMHQSLSLPPANFLVASAVDCVLNPNYKAKCFLIIITKYDKLSA